MRWIWYTLLLFWLTSHSASLFSQSQQKKSVSFSNGWSAHYSYLREGDHETFHGLYLLKNDKGATVLKGKYTHGKKEGLWEYYHFTTGVLAVEAQYSADKPSNTWEYYNEPGQTWMIYNFDKNEVILLELDSRPEPVQYGYSWPGTPAEPCIPDQAPVPLGPYDPLTFIQLEINRIGDESLKSLLQEAAIQFTVDEYGKVSHYHVYHSDAGAVTRFQSILKEYRYMWLPAQKDDFLSEIKVEVRPK